MLSVAIASIVSLCLGAAGTLVLTPLARRLAWHIRALDHPDGRRKTHAHPVPLLGGVAIFVTLAAGAAALHACYGVGHRAFPNLGALLLSAGIACLVGCWDDLRGLRAWWKLAGQFLAATPLVLSGCIVERVLIGGQVIDLGMAGAPLTMLWIVAGINAFNLLDGADGLATLVGLAVAACIAAIAAFGQDLQTLATAALFCGALSGFLVFNAPPARIYLGDAGSMLIGLVASALSLTAGRPSDGTVMPAVALALLAVPIFDAVLAVVRRTLNRRPVWQADRGHIHHRLLDRGLNAWETSLSLALVTLATCGAAFYAAATGRQFLPLLGLCALFCGLVHGRFWAHHEWNALRERLASILVDFAARRWGARLHRDLPSLADLAAKPFPAAWDTLVAMAAQHRVMRLEISAGDGRGAGWRQDWGERLVDEFTGARVVEARHRDHAGGWCKVRAIIQQDPMTHAWSWLTLLNALALFSRHWAAYPQQLQGPRLRVVADDEAIKSRADDRSRAA